MVDKVGLFKDSNFYMETYTGKQVNPLELQEEDVDIVDIAHHLSLICRFSGACRRFYSVGQHSLHVCFVVGRDYLCDDSTCLTALLHDSSEAYLNDVIKPVKYAIKEWREIEARVLGTILKAFGSPKADWDYIKQADNIMLATEAKELMRSAGEGWDFKGIEPLANSLPDTPPTEVESTFLTTFWKHYK